MAKNNEIRIPIKVDGKEILLTKKEADKLAKSLDKTGASAQNADRRLKGAAQASSNSTKNFSKMAQGITGGLVPAYATLAANVFAISAAFRFLQDAANYRILIEGQKEFSTVTGESLKLLTSRLQDATGAQLAFAEAAQSVAIARAAGVTTDQISRLGVLAKNASIALGRDLTDSLNRLIRGVTKAEPELLDELGIILRLETASEKYGTKIGKLAKDLNIFEKSQAVVNEVLEQGESKFGDFNTELNAFSKLAKSFDDLINRLKNSLTGIAEFMAKGLSRNVLALGGAFALLGSNIVSAITPDMPAINVGKAAKGATKDISKFYTGKRLGKFQQGRFGAADIKALEKSMDSNKSTVLNFENFRRSEARKTIAILKAYNLQMEGNNGTTYGRMKAKFLGNLYIMQAEYGRFVGTMKFLARGLATAVSFIGYAGLFVSGLGLLNQFMDKFRDPAILEFQERQATVIDQLKEQTKEVMRLNNTMRDHSNIISTINQLGGFFSNFSYRGIAAAMGSYTSGQKFRGNLAEEIGIDPSDLSADIGGTVGMLGKEQGTIVEQVLYSLREQARQLNDGPLLEDLTERIILLQEALNMSEAGTLGVDNFKAIIKQFQDLEENGTAAQKRLTKFAQANTLITNSITEFNNALAKMRQPTTELSIITRSIGEVGEQFKVILEEFEKGELKNLDKKFEDLFGTYTDAIKTFIGAGKFKELFDPKDAEGSIRKISNALIVEADRIKALEMEMLTNTINQQTNILTLTEGQSKMRAAQIQKEEKVNSLMIQRNNLKTIFDEKVKKGLTVGDAEYAKLDADLALLDKKIDIAEKEANLLAQVEQTFRDSFEASMSTAIQGLLEGTTNLKSAFIDMTKAILSSIAQILAQQAAIAIMGRIPFMPGSALGGREGGIMSAPGYRSFSDGGISDGPTSGYTATLHGTEAVVPLPNGRSIPVEMTGGVGAGGNVTVNVNMSTGESTTTGEDAYEFGRAISAAVQREITNQQKPGGSLSPY